MYTSEPNMCNPVQRQEAIAYVEKAVDAALIFNTNIVRVVSGHGSEGLEPEVCLQSIADGLKACLDYAEEKQVMLAFEDHWGVGTNLKDFMRILELVDDDRLMVNLDTANVGSKDIVELAGLVKDRVVYTHCSELPDGKYGMVIGRGEVDFKGIFTILKNNGFEGNSGTGEDEGPREISGPSGVGHYTDKFAATDGGWRFAGRILHFAFRMKA